MGTVEDRLERLRRFNASVLEQDSALAEETADTEGVALESMTDESPDEADIALESIIMRKTRPVLPIREDAAQLVFVDQADSEIWTTRLTNAASMLQRAIRAVGRVELQGAELEWVGTGWLVAENILVTNRHVANEFAVRDGQGFSFKMGGNGKIAASIDFLEEIDNPATRVFKLVRPLHVEAAPGPDVSFFEIETTGGGDTLAAPILLAKQVAPTENVATIGYPAFDSRIPEPDLMERIYGRIYNKKRLAPGGVTKVTQTQILHNCTTLGGNSGSVVLSLETGEAMGLHFSGSFLTTNYAVRADVVQALLDRVRAGGGRIAPPPPPPPRPKAAARESAAATPALSQGRSVTTRLSIPLTVTVSLDDVPGRSSVPRSTAPVIDPSGGEYVAPDVEAVAADYGDREGYRKDFLGTEIALPSVERHPDDILSFMSGGKSETELRYEHYSVVLSRSRRMCFFSACNIDGGLSKKSKRVGWKWDPRIGREFQIMNECYGSPPRFSRGHMTRREDPGWGDAATAKRGNEDSMHVTNVTPQMQAFNSPIWLALEDYALGHAREDDMKISVFTGAYFADDDPTMYGVRIPRAFWKIIAFIHDETGALCATGYEMNQEQSLQPEEEFVFGQFTSPQLGVATQVSIRSIEQRSGISFGGLAEFDPLNSDNESIDGGGPPGPLDMLEQIRFVA